MTFTPNPKPPKRKKRRTTTYHKVAVKKKDRYSHPKYLAWLRTQPCCNPNCISFSGDIVPAHQRILGRGGTGLKPPDYDALPLCFYCHDEEHAGPVTFWRQGTKAETKVFVQRLCDEHITRFNNKPQEI